MDTARAPRCDQALPIGAFDGTFCQFASVDLVTTSRWSISRPPGLTEQPFTLSLVEDEVLFASGLSLSPASWAQHLDVPPIE